MIFNKLFRVVGIISHKIYFGLQTIAIKKYWQISGVTIGHNLTFRGLCYLFKIEDSKILIGDNVSFVSSSFVNHIGLNRKCSISTETHEATIEIGNNCGFSSTNICCFKSIKIGNNVRVGANTMIMDSDFHNDDPRTSGPKPVQIDNNVWLGANVVVMKGVHIGENTIIGMNSVVTKDIPANVVAAGNPCKIIRSL